MYVFVPVPLELVVLRLAEHPSFRTGVADAEEAGEHRAHVLAPRVLDEVRENADAEADDGGDGRAAEPGEGRGYRADPA